MEVFDQNDATKSFFVDTEYFPEPKSYKVPAGLNQQFNISEVCLDTQVIPDSICSCDYRDTYPIIIDIKPC